MRIMFITKGLIMKNLIYTFRVENEEGKIITSIICDSYENAYYIVSRLLEEGYLEIKALAELISLEVLDYDC